uniref:Uncharacterized protein n=1 Tax=Escherichia coli TaxID=562 RepID=A0A7G9A9M5_ECOLX|nr:hypothetical protein [Escherichia coli]QQM12409.1 hypothetical protein [Escherichia coli]
MINIDCGMYSFVIPCVLSLPNVVHFALFRVLCDFIVALQ